MAYQQAVKDGPENGEGWRVGKGFVPEMRTEGVRNSQAGSAELCSIESKGKRNSEKHSASAPGSRGNESFNRQERKTLKSRQSASGREANKGKQIDQ